MTALAKWDGNMRSRYIGFSIDYKCVLVGCDQGESMGGGYGMYYMREH